MIFTGSLKIIHEYHMEHWPITKEINPAELECKIKFIVGTPYSNRIPCARGSSLL
jgi:hypothetical protein